MKLKFWRTVKNGAVICAPRRLSCAPRRLSCTPRRYSANRQLWFCHLRLAQTPCAKRRPVLKTLFFANPNAEFRAVKTFYDWNSIWLINMSLLHHTIVGFQSKWTWINSISNNFHNLFYWTKLWTMYQIHCFASRSLISHISIDHSYLCKLRTINISLLHHTKVRFRSRFNVNHPIYTQIDAKF
jgi:hypothetical protein